MTKLVVFGAGEIAELADFYFRTDSGHEVVAFTVDAERMEGDAFLRRPLVPFEEVAAAFPPAEHDGFVALGYSRVNAVRRDKYLAMKAMGYRMASYVSSRATVLNGGAEEGRIGDNAFVLEDNTIQPFVTIGSNVTLWSGNHIGHHSTIGDHAFLASHIVVSGGVTVGEACFVGVNATLRDHIAIGPRCVLGANALMMADAEEDGVYIAPASERARVPSHRLRRL